MSALTLTNVTKRYGRQQALAGLNLDVPSGSIFGLIGSNGAGKTTAMGACAGLLKIDGGEISLLGDGPFNASVHAGRVALLPQDSALPLHGRVDDLLSYYGRLQGLSQAACAESVDTLLEWVHLADRRASSVRTLSHGMRRRVAIAQAFLGNPELVFLDEPLNGLDPREARNIRDLLIQRRGTQTVIISSHVLSDLESLCDHAAFMEKGRLLRQGSLSALTQKGGQVTYLLNQSANAIIQKLESVTPSTKWQIDGVTLIATFKADDLSVSALNELTLPILLDAKLGIQEIRTEGSLEGAYLTATEGTQ